MVQQHDVMRRKKRFNNVACPKFVSLDNSDMGGVDTKDEKAAAYRLDCRRKYCFYLKMIFDLVDVAIVNSHIIYMKYGNDMSLRNFKIGVEKDLIDRYSNCKRSVTTSKPSRQSSPEPSMPRDVPTQMSEFREKWMRCYYCKNEGLNNKKIVSCQTCDSYLRSNKERICFLNHHDCISYNIPFWKQTVLV